MRIGNDRSKFIFILMFTSVIISRFPPDTQAVLGLSANASFGKIEMQKLLNRGANWPPKMEKTLAANITYCIAAVCAYIGLEACDGFDEFDSTSVDFRY
jgi:hypothetical protein